MWIKEYGFSDIAILNAQLQSLISLSRYAEVTGDAEAQAFAAEMDTATRNLLPSFNYGACWSLYSLDGNPAPESYQRYHISLLKLLAKSTGAAIWSDTARRWKPPADRRDSAGTPVDSASWPSRSWTCVRSTSRFAAG